MRTDPSVPGTNLGMHHISWRLAAWRSATLLALTAVVACRPEFQLKNLTNNESLYAASFHEYQRHHWDNAVAGFEKLTTDLPARDTLLSRAYWYLASAHEKQGEHLLAAQSFSRLVESFPDDSLADDAALEAARAYKRLWRRPELDPLYGETAISSYNTLIGLYPTSPLIPQAEKDMAELDEMFARKDFDAGMYYFRRKAYDSGNLYFKDVIAKHPNAPAAREAALKLVQSYKAIGYKEDASDMCTQLRGKYPTDREVRDVCEGVASISPSAAKPDSIPAPPASSTKPPAP
jgi:outer membrane assembly lipoprotein YfiO